MTTESTWNRKDLIGIESISAEEIKSIFLTARSFKESFISKGKKLTALEGKKIVNLFIEPSTRTRVAFEIASKTLGADVITIQQSSSSLTKGESLRDTALTIQALMADAIILRHSSAGSPLYLSNIVDIPVINAGDGAHEHPTQALLDCFTLNEHFGEDFSKLNVTILGDILFSRVARSNIHALIKLGANVTLAGPATLLPKSFESFGVKVTHNLKEALTDADAVMLLRIQHERQVASHFPSLGEYTNLFGINKLRSSWLKPNALILHPGPINRGVEIDLYLANSERSVILEQVTNGIAIRMAVLYLCIAASGNVN